MKAALGFRSHSGWAAAVALAGEHSRPTVLDRRHLQLCDGSVPVQPFHAAEGLPPAEAEALLRRCTAATQVASARSMRDMVRALNARGYDVATGCVLLASGRQLGPLQSILASHALIHAAEGEFFRQAIRDGGEACSIAISGEREREILERSAERLHVSTSHLQRRLSDLGREIGPPWRQDENLAALAAWMVLVRNDP